MKYTHNKYLEVDHCNSINVSYILCVNWTELQSIYQDHHDHMIHDISVSIMLPPLPVSASRLVPGESLQCVSPRLLPLTDGPHVACSGKLCLSTLVLTPLTYWLIDTKYLHSADTYFINFIYLPIWRRPAPGLCWWQILISFYSFGFSDLTEVDT